MMPKSETLLQFPCDFPIKIIGKNTASFEKDILDIARQHYPLSIETLKKQYSQSTTYCSLQLTVYALSQETLDAFYRDLTQHPDIQMVL